MGGASIATRDNVGLATDDVRLAPLMAAEDSAFSLPTIPLGDTPNSGSLSAVA